MNTTLQDGVVDRLELELRQLPSVLGVTLDPDGGVPRLQVLIADPALREEVEERSRDLAARYVETPLGVEVMAPPLPVAPLREEQEITALAGVNACRFVRGHRGEVVEVEVVATADGAAAARAALIDRLGHRFVRDHLTVFVEGE